MPMRLHEIQIGADQWSVNSLPATSGLVTSGKLASLVGPSLSAMGDASTGEGLDITDSLAAKAVGALLGQMSDPKAVQVIKELLPDIRKNGKPITFDLEFAEDYGALMRLVGWAIKFNFASFLDAHPALRSIVQWTEQRMSDSELSHLTSTGASGESSSRAKPA